MERKPDGRRYSWKEVYIKLGQREEGIHGGREKGKERYIEGGTKGSSDTLREGHWNK